MTDMHRLGNPQPQPQKDVWIVECRLPRSLPTDFAFVHNQRSPAQGHHFVKPVLHHNDGDSLFPVQLLQNREQFHRAARIHLTDRLIQRQQTRPHRQHRRQSQALAFSAGQCVNAAVLAPRQSHPGQRLGYAPPDHLPFHPHVFQGEPDLVRHGRRKNLVIGILEH